MKEHKNHIEVHVSGDESTKGKGGKNCKQLLQCLKLSRETLSADKKNTSDKKIVCVRWKSK